MKIARRLGVDHEQDRVGRDRTPRSSIYYRWRVAGGADWAGCGSDAEVRVVEDILGVHIVGDSLCERS